MVTQDERNGMGTSSSCAHQLTRLPTSLPVLLSLEHRPWCAAISNCRGELKPCRGASAQLGEPLFAAPFGCRCTTFSPFLLSAQ